MVGYCGVLASAVLSIALPPVILDLSLASSVVTVAEAYFSVCLEKCYSEWKQHACSKFLCLQANSHSLPFDVSQAVEEHANVLVMS